MIKTFDQFNSTSVNEGLSAKVYVVTEFGKNCSEGVGRLPPFLCYPHLGHHRATPISWWLSGSRRITPRLNLWLSPI